MILRKLYWRLRRHSKEDDLRDELAFHLDEEMSSHEARGVDPVEARRAAARDLGNLALVMEDTRATWTWTFWEHLAQDVRYGLRAIAGNKLFSALAILSLALGIGANTAIFSYLEAILIRSLPVADPGSLALFKFHTREPEYHGSDEHGSDARDTETGFSAGIFAYPAFELFHQQISLFTSVFGYQGTRDLNLSVNGQAELAPGEYVTGDYFRGLGVAPAAGRLISSSDDSAGASSVAVVSSAFAARHFGDSRNAPGHCILIDNFPFTIIGVTPPEFSGADPGAAPQFYVPMHADLLLLAHDRYAAPAKRYLNPNEEWIEVMARLRPGVTLPQAQAVLAPQFHRFMTEVNTVRNRKDLPTLLLLPGARGLDALRHRYAKPLFLLMTLVAFVLLIACANLANLLLARAAGRSREMALRLSIGAGRPRVIRQLLTESLLLAGLGGALGLLFAAAGIRFLELLLDDDRSRIFHAGLNWRVLAVTAALALGTGILFGLAPALQATRVDLIAALKQVRTGDRRGRSFAGLSLSRVLLVSQIAVTVLLLVASGLFLRTLSNLHSVDLGFNRNHVLTVAINARQAGHRDPEIHAFYENLRQQFSSMPGVRAATLSDLPLIGRGKSMTMIKAPGAPLAGSLVLHVGDSFFDAMQIPLLLGRAIDRRDQPDSPRVAIVNQAFAKANFGARNPIGQLLSIPQECPKCDIEIVGVSGNARYGDLTGDIQPAVFLPLTQDIWGPVKGVSYELRATEAPSAYTFAVSEILRRADPRVPPSDLVSQSLLIDQTISRQIIFARLSTAFGILALVIASVGLYGAVAYKVARRTGEIGIRMAVGAPRASVVWMILRDVLALVVLGLAVAIPAALVASKLVRSFLFGVRHDDPASLIVSAATVLAAALLAGFIPARRASRIDPMSALRQD